MEAERGHGVLSAIYRLLLRGYPRDFRDRYSVEMERTFTDGLHDHRRAPGSIASMLADTAVGAVRERATNVATAISTASPTAGALLAVACALPLLTTNWIVSQRIEPVFSVIRPGQHTSPQELVVLTVVMLLLPLGAWLAARPLVRTGHARSLLLVIDLAVATVLALGFVLLSVGFGTDFYRCEILQIKGCD